MPNQIFSVLATKSQCVKRRTKYDEENANVLLLNRVREQKNKNFSNYGKPEKLNKSGMEAHCEQSSSCCWFGLFSYDSFRFQPTGYHQKRICIHTYTHMNMYTKRSKKRREKEREKCSEKIQCLPAHINRKWVLFFFIRPFFKSVAECTKTDLITYANICWQLMHNGIYLSFCVCILSFGRIFVFKFRQHFIQITISINNNEMNCVTKISFGHWSLN